MITISENYCAPDKYHHEYYPYIMMVKGAPDKVFDMCNQIYKNGKVLKMTSDDKEELLHINEILAKRGERVLAFA